MTTIRKICEYFNETICSHECLCPEIIDEFEYIKKCSKFNQDEIFPECIEMKVYNNLKFFAWLRYWFYIFAGNFLNQDFLLDEMYMKFFFLLV